ncbi:MAG: DegT/DnrJ/EryC1/StrS family aminotransferase [Aureliella sp.]
MNIDGTHAPAGDLVGEIEAAVAKALVDCGCSAAWRRYTGEHQSNLLAALEEIGGCEHVGLASSGTAALEMLLAACRLEPGDEVLLSGYDYPGTFAAIERAGGRPALVDVAEGSWNLSRESLEATVTPACRVLIASHLHGQLQPIAELERWCAERKICLIQDACQALGASVGGQPLGRFGDATIFSFGGGKTISAGRGGAWATRDPALAQRTRLAAGVGSGTHEMSELQAAVVLAQLPFLPRITERCRVYFAQVRAAVKEKAPALAAPWEECLSETAFYQAGWLLPCAAGQSETANENREGKDGEEQSQKYASRQPGAGHPSSTQPSTTDPAQAGSPLIGLSQSQHAGRQRTGIGSGFQGYHRRSRRRCRAAAPLQNTARVAQRTVTVHHRAALLDAPPAEALAQLVLESSSVTSSSGARPDRP